MKEVTITTTYRMDDKFYEEVEYNIQHGLPSFDYIDEMTDRRSYNYSVKDLYHVKCDKVKPYTDDEGFLLVFGERELYSRGEAIKKARMFDGKIIKSLE
jgi:hypothetical protein